MSERRYTDDEVAKIFERATEAQHTVGVAIVSLAIFALTGKLADPGSLSGIGFLAAGGLTMFGMAALRLPSWARLRQRQMEGVAARLTLDAPADQDSSASRE